MKPVYSETKTDSLAACVASLLEVDLDQIPDFFLEDGPDAFRAPLSELQNFLYNSGWLLIERLYLEEFVRGIAIMYFEENPYQYAVVWQDGTIHDPRPEGSPVGHPRGFFILAPMDITDYVRTVHSQPPDHAYWSQVAPGSDFVVWDDLEDQILYQKFCFYAEGKPWFSDRLEVDTVATFKYATQAVPIT